MKVLANANHELDRLGLEEAELPVGVLFGHSRGIVCVVAGELNELEFSTAVPLELRTELRRQVGVITHENMRVTAHVFDLTGRPLGTFSIHRQHPNLRIATPYTQREQDVCLGASDMVIAKRIPPARIGITYSLEQAHD